MSGAPARRSRRPAGDGDSPAPGGADGEGKKAAGGSSSASKSSKTSKSASSASAASGSDGALDSLHKELLKEVEYYKNMAKQNV